MVKPTLLRRSGGMGSPAPIGEPVVGIQAAVAEELIPASVKFVGAGAPDHIDHRGA